MPDAGSLAGFLSAAGWADAARRPLAGDASSRRYARLSDATGGTAVLMQCAPGSAAEIRRFAELSRHLAALGLSPPRVFAADAEAGLMLLEDLGDDLFARQIAADPGAEPTLLAAAAEVLAELHRHAPPAGLPVLDSDTMPSLIGPLFEWYLDGNAPDKTNRRRALESALGEAIARHAAPSAPVFVHRDFHAENLLWLPDRPGFARVGLLDFQDAHSGHPAYDLVSLVEDARRDTAEPARRRALRSYLDRTGTDEASLAAAMAVVGAQRNLRILGIFARLARCDGKARYLGFVPRVWQHLQRDLSHPALAELAAEAAMLLPPPGEAHLEALAMPCPAIPTPS